MGFPPAVMPTPSPHCTFVGSANDTTFPSS
jgi:hypothetical protein